MITTKLISLNVNFQQDLVSNDETRSRKRLTLLSSDFTRQLRNQTSTIACAQYTRDICSYSPQNEQCMRNCVPAECGAHQRIRCHRDPLHQKIGLISAARRTRGAIRMTPSGGDDVGVTCVRPFLYVRVDQHRLNNYGLRTTRP
ncbi:hypothetical protein Trydic_g11646 [Trypoxylus dichotomus]